jgi:hypothetical protein
VLLDIIFIVETYPNFSSAFQQPLSGTRTQQQSSGILQTARYLPQWKHISCENEGRFLHWRRVGLLALPCFLVPVTQATALIHIFRHLKTRKGLSPYPSLYTSSMSPSRNPLVFLLHVIFIRNYVHVDL